MYWTLLDVIISAGGIIIFVLAKIFEWGHLNSSET